MKKNLITFLLTIIAITANAQCKYCNTYEDFLADRWQELDTIIATVIVRRDKYGGAAMTIN